MNNNFAWDIINEPEWATCGMGARRWSCVRLNTMREFVRDAAALIHRLTGQAATVGCAAAHWLDAWRDVGLDFYQAHWYEHLERRRARPATRPRLSGRCSQTMRRDFAAAEAALKP